MTKPARPFAFTHLYLENWKNFTRVEADLRRRTLIAGPNACGKTNLLDALRFLRDLVQPGGFQEAVRRRGGIPRLRCLAARQHPDVLVSVQAGPDEDGPDWEYELQFTQENLKRPAILRERVTRAGEDVLLRPDERDQEDPHRLTGTALENAHSNREFRELAEFFASIRYVNAVPELIRNPERSVGRSDDPFGGNLLEQIAGTAENIQAARLRRIRDALQSVMPHLEGLEIRRDSRGAPHLRARYGHWRQFGAWQGEEQLSDGTLRLIALLWAALDGTGPLLAEEPEQSLDPAAARELMPMVRALGRRSERQMLIATHSKELLADERIAPEEVLLMVPGEEGTAVEPAASREDAAALLDGCFRPEPEAEFDENQLALFEEL
ncbi:MAG: AAA family ATPase [Acidobacteriota bacterium]